METDGGEVAPLRQISGRPRLVPASSHGGEILKAATGAETSSRFEQRPPVAPIAPEFRPPAPTCRGPHRVKRRINKAARGNSGAFRVTRRYDGGTLISV